MSSSFDFSTLVFIIMAAFVGWRLYSVLGMKTGHEEDRSEQFRPKSDQNDQNASHDNVVPMPGMRTDNGAPASNPFATDRWKGFATEGSPLAGHLDEIADYEKGFHPKDFVSGARAAYEMIVLAFAKGDRDSLKNLLSHDVFEGFSAAIAEREKRGEVMTTTFVSLDSAELVDAHLRDGMIQLSVKFSSKLISATKDSAGTVVEGAPDKIVDVIDIWTFARQARNPNPNWHLIATESAGTPDTHA